MSANFIAALLGRWWETFESSTLCILIHSLSESIVIVDYHNVHIVLEGHEGRFRCFYKHRIVVGYELCRYIIVT